MNHPVAVDYVRSTIRALGMHPHFSRDQVEMDHISMATGFRGGGRILYQKSMEMMHRFTVWEAHVPIWMVGYPEVVLIDYGTEEMSEEEESAFMRCRKTPDGLGMAIALMAEGRYLEGCVLMPKDGLHPSHKAMTFSMPRESMLRGTLEDFMRISIEQCCRALLHEKE